MQKQTATGLKTPPPPRLAFYAFKKAAIISLTMTQFTASPAPAIPFGFHQSRAAVDSDLIGRVNQELMSGGLKCPCWTQKSPLVKVSIQKWTGQSARLGRDWTSNRIPDVTKRRAGYDLQC